MVTSSAWMDRNEQGNVSLVPKCLKASIFNDIQCILEQQDSGSIYILAYINIAPWEIWTQF